MSTAMNDHTINCPSFVRHQQQCDAVVNIVLVPPFLWSCVYPSIEELFSLCGCHLLTHSHHHHYCARPFHHLVKSYLHVTARTDSTSGYSACDRMYRQELEELAGVGPASDTITVAPSDRDDGLGTSPAALAGSDRATSADAVVATRARITPGECLLVVVERASFCTLQADASMRSINLRY